MLAPLNIEQFRDRFYQAGCPVWFAYDARQKTNLVERFRDDEPNFNDEEKLNYSWMQFEDLVNSFEYGKLVVTCKSTANANKDKSPTFTVAWGNLPTRSNSRTTSISNNQMGGNWAMIQWFLAEQAKQTREVQQLQMEVLKTNFENQQLAAALEADSEPNFKEKLLMEGIGAVKTLIAGNAVRPAASLGTMGQRETKSTQVQEQQTTQNKGFSIDEAMKYVKGITDIFPEYDRIEIMKAFYNLALQNKEFIGAQLQNFLSNEQ